MIHLMTVLLKSPVVTLENRFIQGRIDRSGSISRCLHRLTSGYWVSPRASIELRHPSNFLRFFFSAEQF